MNLKLNLFNIFREIVKTVFIILFGIIVFRFYIVQPFLVVGSSMEPNLFDGEYIFVNELGYHFTKPKRSDIIVFKHPDPSCRESVESSYIRKIFIQGPCKNYIKRIIALPGETIEIKNGEIKIINKENPNGFLLNESEYIHIKLFGNQTVTLGKDEYFVIGDNRTPNGSSDSREWGPLSRKFITGKAALIVLPPSRAGLIKTPQN